MAAVLGSTMHCTVAIWFLSPPPTHTHLVQPDLALQPALSYYQVMSKLAECGVKLIAMRCAGFDRVDLAAAEEHGIQVTRVPTYSPTSVAEHAMALTFALNR